MEPIIAGLAILVFGILILLGNTWAERKRAAHQEFVDELEQEGRVNLPPIEEILRRDDLVEPMRNIIANVGFIHTAETIEGGRYTPTKIYSELFISRTDGGTQTLDRRVRQSGAQDLEGEELAKKLAARLDVECRVM